MIRGEETLLGSVGVQGPHISVRLKLADGACCGFVQNLDEGFLADVSKTAPLCQLVDTLCKITGIPQNGVLLMYEGRTLDLEKPLQENNVTLPGPAARRRGDRVVLMFDTVTEVMACQDAINEERRREEERLEQEREEERQRLVLELQRREESRLRREKQELALLSGGQEEIDMDEYVASNLGVSEAVRNTMLQDRVAMEARTEAGDTPIAQHYLTRCPAEVVDAIQKLMHSTGLGSARVLRVYRNENETLQRRYERSKRLLVDGGAISRAKTTTQGLCTGTAPLDFLGLYEPRVNEYPMWHGTPSAAGAGGICSSGFDIAFAGAHGLAWGHGFYFADHAGTSAGYAGSAASMSKVSWKRGIQNCSVMLLCRVLAGNVKHLSQAPTQEQKETFTAECLGPGGTFGAKSQYHSICGDGWAFVCAHRDQVYPAYVIVYNLT